MSFGSVLLFIFVLQVITGIFLTMYYVPSADHAHASVSYIQKAVPGGALLRGLHHYGSSAMVILTVAHLAQTFFYGAYKNKRELLWVAGVVMMLIVFRLFVHRILVAVGSSGLFRDEGRDIDCGRDSRRRFSAAADSAWRHRPDDDHPVALFHDARLSLAARFWLLWLDCISICFAAPIRRVPIIAAMIIGGNASTRSRFSKIRLAFS